MVISRLSLSRLPVNIYKTSLRRSGYLHQRYFLSTSRFMRGGHLEDHYWAGEYATRISSPMQEYVSLFFVWLQCIISAATLFHSNYYFTGSILPKTNGNTQLCEDSW